MILYNAIRTPDGTVIESTHRHDFVCHTDKDGETYCVDGGSDYLRRLGTGYKELSLYSEGVTFKAIRELFKWGTRGKDGIEPLQRKPLCELSDNHIKAILETQSHISDEVRGLFQQELKWRGDIK